MASNFITATPDSTSGDGSISVTVSENNGAARNGTIVIRGGSLRSTISVNQNRGRISVIAVTEYGGIENIVINT